MIQLTRYLPAAHKLILLAPAAGITMLVAACGGVSYGGTSSTVNGGVSGAGAYGGSSGAAGGAAAASVAVRGSSLGTILTDASGRSLYLFQKDSGSTSACDSSCASVWPPLTTTGAVVAGNGASTNLVGTITRADGSKQVSYNGHPVYYYVGDQKPGDTNGQNLDQFGGGWYVLSAAGTQIGN